MIIFAAAAPTAQPTTFEKLQAIPMDFWWKIGLGVALVFGAVIVLRKVAKTNKVILGVVAFVVVTVVGFNWIYERNEPAWATPVVKWLAGFFPSKGKIEEKMRS
jgi:hypothetical protein